MCEIVTYKLLTVTYKIFIVTYKSYSLALAIQNYRDYLESEEPGDFPNPTDQPYPPSCN